MMYCGATVPAVLGNQRTHVIRLCKTCNVLCFGAFHFVIKEPYTMICMSVGIYVALYVMMYVCIYRVSQEECARLREGVPYVKVYRHNPKHICPEIMAREV